MLVWWTSQNMGPLRLDLFSYGHVNCIWPRTTVRVCCTASSLWNTAVRLNMETAILSVSSRLLFLSPPHLTSDVNIRGKTRQNIEGASEAWCCLMFTEVSHLSAAVLSCLCCRAAGDVLILALSRRKESHQLCSQNILERREHCELFSKEAESKKETLIT